MEAWVWLETAGLIAPDPDQGDDWIFITRKGQKIRDRSDFESFKNSASLSKYLLHPIIVQKSWSPFIRGEYETAVFQAFRKGVRIGRPESVNRSCRPAGRMETAGDKEGPDAKSEGLTFAYNNLN